MRRLFRFLGRFILVPMFRLRLGWLVANPISGYLMVVRTAGRKTARPREAAVMYAIADGCVYCMAGWGPETSWYRNVRAHPAVTLLMPSRVVSGVAEEVLEPDERAAALRGILRSSGLTAFSEGANPWRDSEDAILASAARKPVVRVRPRDPLSAGPFDPGGRGWLLAPALVIAAWAVSVATRRWVRPGLGTPPCLRVPPSRPRGNAGG
jgi:deazaflavin-dependent oxidoreductase (nitroreductase family)